MLYTKASTVGIDTRIQALQNFLYPQLKKIWGIANDTAWDCYGRVYRTQTDDGYIPEAYMGGNNAEYKELFFDDTKTAISFFLMGESVKFSGGATAQISMIWMVNLALLNAGTYRNDEEVRNVIQKLLQVPIQGFELTGWDIGIDATFKEFSGWRKKDGIKYRDMQPFHCFRINGDLLYNINDCK